MRSNTLETIFPAGKVFFSAGIRNIFQSEQAGAYPSSSDGGRGGMILIGLGETGEAVLQNFLTRLPQVREDELPLIRPVLITTQDKNSRRFNPLIERFVIDFAQKTDRVRIDTEQKKNMLAYLKKYLEDQFLDFQYNRPGVGTDVRCFIVGNLSECDIGLVSPLLEIFALNRSALAYRAILLMLQSPILPVLSHQQQYAAVREFKHYLQVGIHIPETQISDNLIERLYFFNGSDKLQLEYENHILAMVEMLLSFISGGSELRKYEALAQTSDGNHRIRTIGIRNLAIPVVELGDYFASRLIWDMWAHDRVLYPSYVPTKNDINIKYQAFFKDQLYSLYLKQWLGSDFAHWLKKGGGNILPEEFNKAEVLRQFIQNTLDFLSDLDNPDRFAVVYSGLYFIEQRASGMPAIQNMCRKFRSGLENLYQILPEYEIDLRNRLQAARDVLKSTISGKISRWHIHNLVEQADQIYQSLFDSTQKEKLFEIICQRSGLSARVAEKMILSPVFVSRQELGDYIGDYTWCDYSDYFDRLFEEVARFFVQLILAESEESIRYSGDLALSYLSEAEQPLVDLDVAVPMSDKQGFLLASSKLDTRTIDSIKRQVFKFTSNFVHIPQTSNTTLTALSIFSGLDMENIRHIKQCSDFYVPDEHTHIDEHLRNAAFFEKILRKVRVDRNRELFSEPIVMTLRDRSIPIAFFRAFLAGFLKWDRSNTTWYIDSLKGNNFVFLRLPLGPGQEQSLTKMTYKENLESLWVAYKRFSIDIPYAEVQPGDLHHPMHQYNRSQYLSVVIEHAKKTMSATVTVQNKKRAWLKTQFGHYKDNVELNDFYRLFLAVMRNY